MDIRPEYILGPKGPLSKKLRYFEYRPSQIEYSRAVSNALTQKQIAILEAQTGTGKTLAYLLPALQTGKRVIISTGTKALQEQLYYKDIPLIVNKLGLDFPHVLMKGRTNYLCLLKYERVQIQPMLPSKESVGHFQEIQDWAASTGTGDIAEANVPEQAEIWRQLTISSEACLGAKCRFYNDCYVTKLKQRAEQSRIIVVNHHLFFADLSLQILSSTSILPSYDLVIFDEAHQLADVATHNLSIVFSQRMFAELYQDLLRELQILRIREKQNVDGAQDRVRKLGESAASLFDKFRSLPQRFRYDNRGISRIVERHPSSLNALFATLLEDLLRIAEKTEDMPQLYRRLATAQSSLGFLLEGTDDAYVYWAEQNEAREWTLQASPLDVSGVLRKWLWPHLEGAVLTSATLFVDEKTIAGELGIEKPVLKKFPYNFDYNSQACLYIPKNIPDPTHPQFPEAAADQIAEIIKVTQGGAFVLCTSYQNMRTYEATLRRLDYPLLVQGTRAKQALLKSFLKNPGSVLLATMSFWQGIDVQGDALICVVIDKLPFAVPNDPLVEAKIQYLRKLEREPFLEYQVPSAVMMLKQGLGRLIRTSVDYGVLAVLDRRLITKNYGQIFLRNLPQMPIVHTLNDLEKAFRERRERFVKFH